MGTRVNTLEQALLSGEGGQLEDQITLVLVKKGIIDCENNTQCDDDKACLDSYKEPGRMLCEPVCERYQNNVEKIRILSQRLNLFSDLSVQWITPNA